MFIGREKELNELESRYAEDTTQLIVVYGKRRLGKTALLKEFAKDKTHFFYVSRETIDSEQIKLFSEEILEDNPVKEFITSFDNWEKAFLFLINESKTKKILLIIDEFPYIAQSNKEILSILQKIWDQNSDNGKLMCVLTGSSLSYMESELLGEDSPLYGRMTSTIKLEALTFQETKDLLKDFSLTDQIAYYGILGGIPRYLKALDSKLSLKENLCKLIINKYSSLHQEINLLMREDLREPSTYYAILSAIASGADTIKDIAKSTSLDKTKINVYLKSLMQLNILYRKVPLLLPNEKANMHRSMYLFKEPFFKFYFYYMVPNLSTLEKLNTNEFYNKKIEPTIENYIEKEFQNIGIEHLKTQNLLGNLNFTYEHIGNTWNDKLDLPIFGFVDDEHILSGKCIYNRIPTLDEINELKHFTAVYTNNPRINTDYYFITNIEISEDLENLQKIDKNIHFIVLN